MVAEHVYKIHICAECINNIIVVSKGIHSRTGTKDLTGEVPVDFPPDFWLSWLWSVIFLSVQPGVPPYRAAAPFKFLSTQHLWASSHLICNLYCWSSVAKQLKALVIVRPVDWHISVILTWNWWCRRVEFWLVVFHIPRERTSGLYVPSDFYSKRQSTLLVCRIVVFCAFYICLIFIYCKEFVVLCFCAAVYDSWCSMYICFGKMIFHIIF
jgi:hypothetical protein